MKYSEVPLQIVELCRADSLSFFDRYSRIAHLEEAIRGERERLPNIAAEQIQFWEREKARISELPHSIAVSELIAALKIDSKIETIRRTAGLRGN